MKKQMKSIKKLSLNKETLVRLDGKQLQGIRGGMQNENLMAGTSRIIDTSCGTVSDLAE